jgi:hypothetical protein
MATKLRKCFNGHVTHHPGCAGCHHAFHVIEAGRIEDGRLVSPVVDGPGDCALCHRARHASPVDGCPQCEGGFSERLEVAMLAAKPFRQEMWSLRFVGWFLGWQMWLASWLTMLAGGTMWDWFRRADGSQDWLKAGIAIAAVPILQWFIRRKVARDERMLPRLDGKGHIVYGGDSQPRDD